MGSNRKSTLLITFYILGFGVLASISSNIASSTLPDAWKSYLWLAWPLCGMCTVASIGLTLWQEHHKSVHSDHTESFQHLEARLASINNDRQRNSTSTGVAAAFGEKQSQASDQENVARLEFALSADIPLPPQPYIAHIYTLMQTPEVVGRKKELDTLKSWISQPDSPDYAKYMFVITALGGMGKSALAWQWFNDIVPNIRANFAGRIWWNFYRDSNFEHFIRKALLYTSKMRKVQIEQLERSECEDRLLNTFRNEPYLLVLDGLERILRAYPILDIEPGQEIPSNRTQHSATAPSHVLDLQNPLRQTTDPRAGLFLRELSQTKMTRVLISTRLYPAALQADTGGALPGCAYMQLQGLEDNDALQLWKTLDVQGDPALLLDTFRSFHNYPLLIKILAGLVARDRVAPGNFNVWRKNNSQFDFASAPLAIIRQDVLSVAIQSLDTASQSILYTIAAARTPLVYLALVGLLVGNNKLCADQHELDQKLEELEDRGLLGWDKKNNRYDIHPIVQSNVMSKLNAPERKETFIRLYNYFTEMPKVALNDVRDWSDLIPDIEIYNALIGLRTYDQAIQVFRRRLEYALLELLSDNSRVIDLLRMLFPHANEEEPPLLTNAADQAYIFHTLARAYQFSEQPGRAVPLHRRALDLFASIGNLDMIESMRILLADALHAIGMLYASETITYELAADPGMQDYSRAWLWIQFLLMTRGARRQVRMSFLKDLASTRWKRQHPSANNIALGMFRLRQYDRALALANRAEEQSEENHHRRDLIRAIRLQGAVALQKGSLVIAERYLSYALSLARKANYAEGELPALIGLAELERRRHRYSLAREYLGRVWQPAEFGPYPLIHADARNVLAWIERDEGHMHEAVKAAQEAYKLAWCDGPIFVYARGLEEAEAHLRFLNAMEQLPSMPRKAYPVPDHDQFPLPRDLI